MADNRRIVDMLVDVTTGQRVVAEGNTVLVASGSQQILWRGSQLLYRCSLYTGDQTQAFSPPSDAVWLFGIDSVFTADHTDLVTSLNAQFNISGDWGETSVVGGKICWRADLTGTELKDDLGSDSEKTMYACLWMCPVGGSYTLLSQWEVTMKNVAVDPTTAQEIEGVSFATTDLVTADYNAITSPTSGLYRIKNGAVQLYNPTQSKYHTISVAGAAGVETISIGAGET